MKLHTMQLYRGLVALMIATSHAIEVFNHRGFVGLDFLKTRTGGVDFFFTLSGFLIFYAYSKYVGNKTAIKTFLLRRFLRIYPLVWFFTLLSLPVYFLTKGIGNGNETNLSSILGSLLLIPQTVDPVLGATWSLSHVVLFYLAFTIYLSKPRLFNVLLLAWILLFLVNLLFFYSDLKSDSIQVWKQFLFSPFNFQFLFGALLARWSLSEKFGFGKTAVFIGFSVFIAIWYLSSKTSSPLLLAFIFCIASMLMIYGGVAIDRSYTVRLPNIANVIGNASYAIIIVNLPVIVAISRVYEKLTPTSTSGPTVWGSWVAVLIAVTTAMAGGVFTHKIIEPGLLYLIKAAMKSRSIEKA